MQDNNVSNVERVINGLECCMSGQPEGLGCDRVPCPYNDIEDCEGALHYDALALLKAQEPVEPKKNDVELAGLRTWDWACPECNCILTYRANYCSCCGRAVKWDD